MDNERLFSLVEQYDTITIYRHIAADSDALGSQFGLRQWIKDKYPQKHVYALGESIGSNGKHFPQPDEVDDETIASSLAIILDTANVSRIDDKRWKKAAYKLKIDHHIFVEKYADEELIDDWAGATCEILARMLETHKEILTTPCAEYLYSGIIADTLQFSINATTPRMLRTAAYLLEFNVDVPKVNQQNFSKSLKEYQYETYIRSHATIIEGKLAYCIITKEEYEVFKLTLNEAKEKVYALSKVNEFETWALFVQVDQDGKGNLIYNGSLRSKQKPITDIAGKYHGGGHRLACGVKNLRDKDIKDLLQDLLQNIQ